MAYRMEDAGRRCLIHDNENHTFLKIQFASFFSLFYHVPHEVLAIEKNQNNKRNWDVRCTLSTSLAFLTDLNNHFTTSKRPSIKE
jgi:hypothetical protein